MRRFRTAFTLVALVCLVIVVLVGGTGCSTDDSDVTPPPAENGTAPPSDNGAQTPSGETDPAQIVQTRCTRCHNLERVDRMELDEAGWDAMITRMEAQGLIITPQEKAIVAEYLANR